MHKTSKQVLPFFPCKFLIVTHVLQALCMLKQEPEHEVGLGCNQPHTEETPVMANTLHRLKARMGARLKCIYIINLFFKKLGKLPSPSQIPCVVWNIVNWAKVLTSGFLNWSLP